MIRLFLLLFLFLCCQFSISQSYSQLKIELHDIEPIVLKSYSNFDNLDILVSRDTVLVIPISANNLFSLSNDSFSYDIFLTNNSFTSVVLNNNNQVHVSGENTEFILFMNEYNKRYRHKLDTPSLLYQNNNSIDVFEINLYNLLNKDIFNFYISHESFSDFSPYSKQYFEDLLKYEYLSIFSSFLAANIDNNAESSKIPFTNIDLSVWLDWDMFQNSFADSSFLQLPCFNNYIYNSSLIFALSQYDFSIKKIEHFQHFTIYFLNFLSINLPQNSLYYIMRFYIERYAAFLQTSTMDYMMMFLENYSLDRMELDNLKRIFSKQYNSNIEPVSELDDSGLINYDFYMEDLKGNKSSLDAFNGKVLYIDIWASWCGPCRKQFPYAEKLKNQFSKRQLKKIDFIYISIDNDYVKWKKSLDNLKIQGEHFISPANNPNGAGNYFQAFSIPRYILINKKGEIVSKDAKRPGDTTLFDELIELINE